jgi:membrane protease YdiL (CAAX protease family)
MSENVPVLPLADNAPPSTDLQLPPTASGGAAVPPDLGLPTRSIVREPRWPHPNLGWSFLWCLLFMFVTQVPGAVVVVAVVMGLAVVSPDTLRVESLSKPADLLKSPVMNVALGIAFFITELLVIGFSLLSIRLVVGRDWTRQLALKIPGPRHTLLALASLPAMGLLGNVSYEILRKILHVPSLADFGLTGMEEMVQVFSKWPWAFAVLVIGLGPGIGEELWCRGFLGRGLVGNYGVVFGVFATSFFFGFIHLDPCQGAMAMLMGLWLHFVYLTTRSLLLPMLLHALNNSLAVLDTRLPQLAVVETKSLDIPFVVYAAALFLLMATAFALYQSRARLAPKSPDQLLLWRPEFDGVEYPPDDSGMQVVRPAPSLVASALAGTAFALFVVAFALWISGT